MREKFDNYEATAIIAPLLLSLVACGSGGSDSGPDIITGPETLDVIADSRWSMINSAPVVDDIKFNGSKYVAVGKSGYLADSPDGITWTQHDTDTAESLMHLAVSGNNMVAASLDAMFVTTDGATWTAHKLSGPDCVNPNSLLHDGSQFVGLFYSSLGYQTCISRDGTAWTKIMETIGQATNVKLSYGGGYYVRTEYNSGTNSPWISRSSSLSAVDWELLLTPIGVTGNVTDFLYADSRFVAITDNGNIMYSDDNSATTWSKASTPYTAAEFNRLSYSIAKGFIAYNSIPELYRGISDDLLASSDGITWSIAQSVGQPINLVTSGVNESIALGYSGRRFRSTDDLATWVETNANQPVGDIVATTENSGSIYVATHELYEDSNAGPIHTSKVFKSSDDGITWAIIHTANNTVQDLIHDASKLIVANDDGIIATTDDGATWSTLLDEFGGLSSASVSVAGVTYYVGVNGSLLSSTDGINFLVLPRLTSDNLHQIASNGTGLVAISGAGAIVAFDGTSWSTTTIDAVSDIVWNGSVYVAAGSNSAVFTSPDGITWTTQTHSRTGHVTDILSDGSFLVTAGTDGIATSSDHGVSWTNQNLASTSTMKYLAFDGRKYYAFSDTSVYTSIDAVTWSSLNSLFTNPAGTFSNIEYLDGQFISHTRPNISSTDGETWAVNAVISANDAFAYQRANSRFADNQNGDSRLAINSGIYSFGVGHSLDGTSWTLNTGQGFNPGYTPASGVYAKLYGRAVSTSTDGQTWTAVTPLGLPTNSRINGLEYLNDQYVAWVALDYDGFIRAGAVYTSFDAINWTEASTVSVDGFHPRHIGYDGINYVFFAEGDKGHVMVLQTDDLQSFTLYDSGVTLMSNDQRGSIVDVDVSSSGYTIIGNDATLAIRSVYP